MALTPKTPKTTEEKKAKATDAEQDMLLREVDDAVRQDDAAQFAQKYGKIVIGVLVAGLLAFAGFLYWQGQNEGAMEGNSEALIGALDELEAGNLATAKSELAALADGAPGPAAAAAMLQAGIAAQDGQPAQAAEMFAAVAADPETPKPLADLALIRSVAANYDAMDKAEVVTKLKPLAVPGNAYFGSAGELVAMAYLEQGKEDLAGPLFAQIAQDETVPASLRARARQMAGVLGYDAVEDVDSTLEEFGGETAGTAG
ncbi:tetratricopeptide repeat protein [Paraurantiacibacter namhicola]|uniref:tetratricopeptide repeat protein n=1 Tax=Paraurantiacibacter namhicola TaxID=645517 RepID=UPI00082DA79C|nr:tetratricopeptide repeat protein [Paraurantiacibacter namhicola]